MKKPVTIRSAWIQFSGIVLAAIITGIVYLIVSSNNKKNGNFIKNLNSLNELTQNKLTATTQNKHIEPEDTTRIKLQFPEPNFSEKETQQQPIVETSKVFIDVNLDRADSKVYIDGELMGTAPDTFNIKKGEHQLKLTFTDPYGDEWEYHDSIYISKDKSIRVRDNYWIKTIKR